MNSEPVAWMDDCSFFTEKPDDMDGVVALYVHSARCDKCNDTEWVCENHPDQEAHKCIYCGGAGMPCGCTHSVKELTDEEMIRIADENLGDSFDYDIMWLRMFVQAILRKAQEK